MTKGNPFIFRNSKHQLNIIPSGGNSWKVQRRDFFPNKTSFTQYIEKYFYPYNTEGYVKAVRYFNKRVKELKKAKP